jgi:hypothetical protein
LIVASGCFSSDFRQFDFWIGEWDVVTASGEVAGRNTIARDLDGCVLREHWHGASGVTGTSLNVYTPATARWHQTWIDSTGTFLQLQGGLVNGAMRLEGEGLSPAGRSRDRITWTPQPDDTVRQRWESSTDDGRTWPVVFDGIHRRRPA